MEMWGPKLPSGWRYPSGRRKIKQVLDDVPDIRVRFDLQWKSRLRSSEENEKPVVAEAMVYRVTSASPWHPYVTIYGWREGEYPRHAMIEFVEQVLPRIQRFLLAELEKESASANLGKQKLEVLWRKDHHEIAKLDKT